MWWEGPCGGFSGPICFWALQRGDLILKKYKLLLLDFDGTLIDSRQDIANATNATLNLWGIAPMSTPTICSFVGSGVKELLKAATESVGCDVSDDQIKEGIAFFKSNEPAVVITLAEEPVVYVFAIESKRFNFFES